MHTCIGCVRRVSSDATCGHTSLCARVASKKKLTEQFARLPREKRINIFRKYFFIDWNEFLRTNFYWMQDFLRFCCWVLGCFVVTWISKQRRKKTRASDIPTRTSIKMCFYFSGSFSLLFFFFFNQTLIFHLRTNTHSKVFIHLSGCALVSFSHFYRCHSIFEITNNNKKYNDK